MGQKVFIGWLFGVLLVTAPTCGSDRSLIISECVVEQGVCARVDLVRYSFEDGYLQSRTKSQLLDIHFGLGQNRIVDNCYAISNWGDIFDLRGNALLHEGVGKVIAVEGSLVVHAVDRTDIEGIFTYDLATQKYDRLEHPGKWSLPGLLAPDQKKSISVPFWGGGEAELHTLDGKKRTLASGLGVELAPISSDSGVAPLLWIDNETVLTQRSNGKLILLKTDGTTHPVVNIPFSEPPTSDPDLSRGPAGQVLYSCGGDLYEIDVDGRQYVLLNWLDVGEGFEIELNAGPRRAKRIRYQGKDIGEHWCSLSSATTTNGHIAVEYGAVGSNLGYPDGIAVWSAESQKWTQLPIRFIEAPVGWADM